jgi:hypothetical protein
MSFMFSKESQETIERVLNKLNDTRSKSEPVQQGGNVSYSPSNDSSDFQDQQYFDLCDEIESLKKEIVKLNDTRSKSEPVQQDSNSTYEFGRVLGENMSYSPSYDFQNYQKPEVELVEDLVEEDDLRLIVQLRTEDNADPNFQRWLDTNIDADDLDEYRESFPGSEYRLVAVYDEIVEEVDSVDQQYFDLYDEIESLKEEIVKLKAQIADMSF